MGTYLKLAWRNLWRNRKRTVIAASSVFFAVFLALAMRSMQKGSYDFMIDSSVRISTGYIQVHAKDYWDKRSLDKSMVLDPEVISKISKLPDVTLVIPRFETFTLVSHGNATKVSPIVGINPDKERTILKLQEKLVSGKYLTGSSKGVLIGQGLAELLKVGVGDSIVLYGQGFHAITAAALVPVQGIIKLPIPEMNKTMIYCSLSYAQWLYSAPGRLTSLSIMIDRPNRLDEVRSEVKKFFDDKYEVMTWKEMTPELVQSIEVDSAGGIIMLAILYIVIGFGIFGTIMMMTTERTKEFGILIAVGMKKTKLIMVTTIETIFISLIGVFAGIVISYPILLYFYYHPIKLTGELAEAMLAFGVEPIMPFSIAPGIFIAQFWTVLLIALLSAWYPFRYVHKLKAVEAIRN
ncbi:MAG TPA: FtsX-like permease family protein [Ignavibacteriaceae bacterium]|nr:FtsX-like permease family protein [Ignavibacteriaceae bacterium]